MKDNEGFTHTPSFSVRKGVDILHAKSKNIQPRFVNTKKLGVTLSFKGGFTLIELLVVIAIIGILSSTVMTSVNTARDKAKIAQAKSQLRNIRSGIAMLESDTGKTLFGCPIGTSFNGSGNEKNFNNIQLGLVDAPSGSFANCGWTSSDELLWKGPYIKSPLDPWGNPYIFDQDYYPYQNCGDGLPEHTATGVMIMAILSAGPNGEGDNNEYDCDDIFFQLQ